MTTREPKVPLQPVEDMFGRPTNPQGEEEEAPPREAQTDKASDEEASYGGVGELPDGDGVRSDKGTNPVPSSYWSAYPGNKPGED